MVIYLITNLFNDAKYVGQTAQNPPETRWMRHVSHTNNGCELYIHRAMRKYGIDNFMFEVIDESSSNLDELNDLEEFYISFYDTFKGVGYNLTSGGGNYIMSEGTKKKMSESRLGNKYSLGHKHTEQTKRNISKSLKNKKVSKETRQKMSDSRKGKFTGIQSKLSKRVIQMDLNSGIEIACWFSTMDIQRKLGILNQCISAACNGVSKSAGGFKWKYLTSE